MKTPLSWLYEFCDPKLSDAQLSDRLDLTGTAVERIYTHGVPSTENFVVGKVLTCEKHPDADKLSLCSVDVGETEPSQIVCGAPNAAAGLTVAVAKPGSVMPDGTKLKKAKLRGVESFGMILAEDELGLGVGHKGIMVLDDELAAGTPLADVLPISERIFELEITPNRPDCLGIYGVAREVHAATGTELMLEPWANDPGSDGENGGANVTVDVVELCPRFTARVFENVSVGESPLWLKARLLAAGQRPISNVVDITNYAMLLTGQPSHAFDLDKVAGKHLTVRKAADGEKIETLDGVTHELDAEMVLVCDDDGPTAIAGVMGGARSEVGEGTSNVLIEVATWVGPNIHRTSTKLGLRSEASSRFEKQLSVEQTLEAQAVISQLMIDVCGATLLPGTIDVGGPGPEPAPIRLRTKKVEAVLGKAISAQISKEILEALGFSAESTNADLDVVVPHFRRHEVTREIDLIEEIARIDGLAELPATLPARHNAVGALSFEQKARRRAEDLLADRGLFEIIGWSFATPSLIKKLRIPDTDPRARAVEIQNPMSSDHSIMRTTLLGSLLDTAAFNVARGAKSVRIFESGAVYLKRDGDGATPAYESHHIAGLMTGGLGVGSWRDPEVESDFYALKATLKALLDGFRVDWMMQATDAFAFLHPGKGAAVTVNDAPVAWLGELHPLVAAEWGLEGPVALFGMNFDALLTHVPRVPQYQEIGTFPSVRQDLALLAPDDITAAQIEAVLSEAGGKLLEQTHLFDVYRGEQVGTGLASLAFTLEFRAPDRTLTDEEVTKQREKILSQLETKLGVKARA